MTSPEGRETPIVAGMHKQIMFVVRVRLLSGSGFCQGQVVVSVRPPYTEGVHTMLACMMLRASHKPALQTCIRLYHTKAPGADLLGCFMCARQCASRSANKAHNEHTLQLCIGDCLSQLHDAHQPHLVPVGAYTSQHASSGTRSMHQQFDQCAPAAEKQGLP